MNRFLLIWAILGGAMLFSSCEDFWGGCIEGNNRPMEERRSIPSFDLLQSTCHARIMGSGSIYIHVSDQLDALILGSGNVYYRGQPSINTQITGSGNVIRYRRLFI